MMAAGSYRTSRDSPSWQRGGLSNGAEVREGITWGIAGQGETLGLAIWAGAPAVLLACKVTVGKWLLHSKTWVPPRRVRSANPAHLTANSKTRFQFGSSVFCNLLTMCAHVQGAGKQQHTHHDFSICGLGINRDSL